jgi:hypothetical protein
MVKTFVCPKDAGAPVKGTRVVNMKYKKQNNNYDENNRYDRRNHRKDDRLNETTTQMSDRKQRQEEVKELMNDVKTFSSQTFVGQKKKVYKEDKLTNLGIDVPKQQTMPFKMALGVREGRMKRAIKGIERSKESGVVLNKSMTYQKIKDANIGEKEKLNKKRMKEERHGAFDIGTKQGVMRLKRSRLPSGLID